MPYGWSFTKLLEYVVSRVIAQIVYLRGTSKIFDDTSHIKYNIQELHLRLIECVLNYIRSH